MTASAPNFSKSLDRLLAGEFDFLPFERDFFLSDSERRELLGKLQALPYTFEYEGMPPCWGKAFENYLSMQEYLAPHPHDTTIAELCAPINARIINLLEFKGLRVEVLQDTHSQMPYTVGDFRTNLITAESDMLHVDELSQDGSIKPDFVLPDLLVDHPYHQLMVLVQLNQQGPLATLRTYNRRYQPEDDQFRLENGWQFADVAVAGADFVDFQPQTGDAFLMANQYFHDIRGAGQDSAWTYYSLYILSVPSLNLALLYI